MERTVPLHVHCRIARVFAARFGRPRSLRVLAAACLGLTAASVPGARAHPQEPVPDTLAQKAVAPDTSAREPGAAADTTTLDSLEAEIARELGADTVAVEPPGPPPSPGAPGPLGTVVGGGQSLNPDISVIGDFLVDLSPDRSTLEGGDRFAMREVELGFQAAVDPYFRADFFLGLHEDVIELEEGYLTTLALPHGLQARAGRFHLPFGKVNLTHRPELHTIEYPLLIQDFFGEEGFASTGLWASEILSPLGFYQELIAVVGNDLGEDLAGGHEHGAESGDTGDAGDETDDEDEAEERDLFEDLGDRLFLGHLKNYVDLSEAANLEVGLSAATGHAEPGHEDSERLTFWGVDAIYRWRPPAQGLYRSLIVQTEAAWRERDAGTDFGAFVFAQVQVGRRWYVGARLDHVDGLREEPGEDAHGISGYLTYYPSEFSLFRAGYEHRETGGSDDLDRLLIQAGVTLGPHRPHPF